MDYKEKAKAFDEALERARNLHKDAIDMKENLLAKQCEIIFPELAESKDEEIRKALISMFKHYNIGKVGNVTYEEIITWLEKQGDRDINNLKTEERGCHSLTPEEIKKRLRKEKVINTVIGIAQDKGTRDQKICEIRDHLLYAITSFYWDEVEI